MKHFFTLLPSFFHRFQFLHFYMNNKRTTRTTRTTVTTVTKNEQQQHQVQNHAKEGKLMSRTLITCTSLAAPGDMRSQGLFDMFQ